MKQYDWIPNDTGYTLESDPNWKPKKRNNWDIVIIVITVLSVIAGIIYVLQTGKF